MNVFGVVVMLSCVLWSGCKERNFAVCCVSEADCSAAGIPVGTECMTGFRCTDNTCVAATCASDSECDAVRPFCRESVCVECDTDEGCSIDEPVCNTTLGSCEACTSHDECAEHSPLQYCFNGGCSQCVESAHCGVDAPVCDNGSCRQCNSDGDCPSGACQSDGTCLPLDAAAYISELGNDSGACSYALPCRSLLYVLQNMGSKTHLVMMPGAYGACITSLSIPNLMVHGTGAIVSQSCNSTSPSIEIRANVTIRGLSITNTGTGVSALRIVTNTKNVLLEHVKLTGAKKLSVEAGASITARDLTVTTSSDPVASIIVQGAGMLRVERGHISGGRVGIQALAGAQVSLTNVMVSGTSGRAFELAEAGGDLSFVTAADVGRDVVESPCALTCNSNVRVSNSIIWQPICGGTVRDAAGPCTFSQTIASNSPTAGITNVDPAFVSSSTGDFHISGSSPAKDVVDTGPTSDFEADPRPRGMKFDIGADEAP